MKKYNNIYKVACLSGLLALGATSCQDWLTVLPQTQIVEENFWEDKNDLEGVRYAAYQNMCSTVDKMIMWGDLRSDAYEWSTPCTSDDDRILYREIMQAQLNKDSARSEFEWGQFYTTINYCNKVLQHGAQVLERDKQFTSSEWQQMKGEITALRALNYFYLLRSFKDIPYSTQVINKDTEVKYFGATNQLVVLDSLILDVENIQGTARNRYSQLQDNKGLITNAAIYAMLADMYLWRASLREGRYKKTTDRSTDTVIVNNIVPTSRVRNLTINGDSIYVVHNVIDDYKIAADYADLALQSLDDQNKQENKLNGTSAYEKESYGLPFCEMYKNDFKSFNKGTNPKLYAYNQIFTQGNSQESIFELQFNEKDSRQNNSVSKYWGYTATNTRLQISRSAINAIYAKTPEQQYRDSRLWFSAWDNVNNAKAPGWYCFKWNGVTPTQNENSVEAKDIELTSTSSAYRNWIIYRMSDMMLIKAEALCAAGDTKTAMQYVNALHRRWFCNDNRESSTQPSTNVTDNYGSANDCDDKDRLGNAPKAESVEIAIMNERLLEFLGEGKRWFDLVRYAERHASDTKSSDGKVIKDNSKDDREWTENNPVTDGNVGVDMMVDKFLSITYSNIAPTLKNNINNRYGLYNIINYMEIKASIDDNGVRHLEQNPLWGSK